MNLLFLLIVACLILLALLFILPPLWRPQTIAPAAINERNIAIAKHRLTELTEQLQANVLSQAQYEEQRAELEQALSDDLDLAAQQTPSNTQQGKGLSYVLLITIPVLAALLYWHLGNFQAVSPTPEMLATKEPESATQQALPNAEAINKMVAGLAEKMKTDPKNADGWLMLGKSYQYLQRYDQAVDAYQHAYQLLGDKTDVMLSYAEALSFANNEQVVGKAADLVFKAVVLEPNNPKALWMAGMSKAQAGEFVAAKKLWTQLAALLPQGSQAQKETQGLLIQLDAKIAESGKQTDSNPANQAAAPVSTSAATVAVQVSLAPELQTQTSPTDTVFIYAQAVSGPQMPLAIARQQVRDLPLTVNLTDAQAMTPAMKLSNFANVKLLARISKSGNAMKQAGDLLGSIDTVAITDKTPHSILINSVVK